MNCITQGDNSVLCLPRKGLVPDLTTNVDATVWVSHKEARGSRHGCIALSRDPSTRHLDGQFQIWTGKIFRGRVTTRHSVIRPRPGSLYDGCHCVITGI